MYQAHSAYPIKNLSLLCLPLLLDRKFLKATDRGFQLSSAWCVVVTTATYNKGLRCARCCVMCLILTHQTSKIPLCSKYYIPFFKNFILKYA